VRITWVRCFSSSSVASTADGLSWPNASMTARVPPPLLLLVLIDFGGSSKM
jgi:hypothetical protein